MNDIYDQCKDEAKATAALFEYNENAPDEDVLFQNDWHIVNDEDGEFSHVEDEWGDEVDEWDVREAHENRLTDGILDVEYTCTIDNGEMTLTGITVTIGINGPHTEADMVRGVVTTSWSGYSATYSFSDDFGIEESLADDFRSHVDYMKGR